MEPKDEEEILATLPFYGILMKVEKQCNFEINRLWNCVNSNQDTWTKSCVTEMLAINCCAEKFSPEIVEYRKACSEVSKKLLRCTNNSKDPGECERVLDEAIKCYTKLEHDLYGRKDNDSNGK